MPDDPSYKTTPTPQEWDTLWLMIQELGAALQPALDSADPPAWAERLGDALDAAQNAIPDHLTPEVSDAE